MAVQRVSSNLGGRTRFPPTPIIRADHTGGIPCLQRGSHWGRLTYCNDQGGDLLQEVSKTIFEPCPVVPKSMD